MTAFFIPGADAPGGDAEALYAGICESAQAETGEHPQPQRIFRLSFRHEGIDVEAEVGQPDPVAGQTVLAILDLGRGSPYLIHCTSRAGSAERVVVNKPVYAATEFTN